MIKHLIKKIMVLIAIGGLYVIVFAFHILGYDDLTERDDDI